MNMVRLGVLVGVVLTAQVAHADVTGSFDGQLTGKKVVGPVLAAAALSQIGNTVTGTVAFSGDPATSGGAYLVSGRATKKRVKLSGFYNTTAFRWQGKIVGDTIKGKGRLKGPGTKILGTLVLNRNLSTRDGSSCDAVYVANQTFFTDQVLGLALTSCTACHVPGGQASATRLHVTPNDPLATARAIAPLVDSTTLSASRVLEKPLNVLPHGGGQKITPGSPEEQALMQWVSLVAQAACN